MTNEEKRAVLGQYQLIERELKRLREEYHKEYDLARRITPLLTGSPRGKTDGNRVENAASAMADIRRDISRQIVERRQARRRILAIIGRVDDATYRELLTYRYIDGLYFEDVADKMGYSYRHIKRLHMAALDAVKI